MGRRLRWVVVFFGACFAATSSGAKQVYTGQEAAALRCANTVAYTAVTLHAVQKIGDAERDVMLGVSVLILERHVSGNWAQKKAAMAVVRDRRTLPDTLADYQKNAARCLVQFPIN